MWICRSPWNLSPDKPPFRNRVEKKRETRGERLLKSKAKEEASARGVDPDAEDELLEGADLVPHAALERALVTMAGYSTRYHWIGIYLVDGEDLHLEVFRGAPCEHEYIARDAGVVGAVASSGRAEIVPDVAGEPRYLPCRPEIRSEIVVPIPASPGPLGVIDVESSEPAAFGERDLTFLENLATDLAQKIEAHRRAALEDMGELETDEEEGDES